VWGTLCVCRMHEILAGIEEEDRVTEGLTWKEYLLPANRLRMFIAVTMQIGMLLFSSTHVASFPLSPTGKLTRRHHTGVQLTGNTSLAYCKPPLP
jgi:hypothetical protein